MRKAAHDQDHASAALAYALQFEGAHAAVGCHRQVGAAVTTKRRRRSSTHGKKWIGPMWSQIDQNMILRYTPAKTQFTTGAQVTLDLRECPMVLAELGKVPDEARRGPLIVNPNTGFPYRQSTYYHSVEAGREGRRHPGGLWSRDLRAGAATEGGQAGADDRRHGQAVGACQQADDGRSL